jgi:hypothetical protein
VKGHERKKLKSDKTKWRITWLVVLITGMLVLHACKRKTGEATDLKQEYFPTALGQWVIYDVIDIRHDINHDTLSYQLKEIIADDFIDNSGRLAQRIERYVRTTEADPWTISDVWHSVRTTRSAEKVEEDVRFVKMEFPMNEFKSWDGNVYNQYVKWEYFYDSLDYSGSVGTLEFDSLAFVTHRQNSNFVEYEQAYEVYAKHIGLVQKQLIDLDVRSGAIVLDSIIKGIELYQTVVSYGND